MASPATTAPSTSTTQASAPTPAPAASSAAPAAAATAGGAEIIPSATTLLQAARLAIQQDKPIQLDYYVDTANLKAFIGEDPETKDKILMKTMDEYTSLIKRIMKASDNYIVQTENSIYIVSGKMAKRRINAKTLKRDD